MKSANCFILTTSPPAPTRGKPPGITALRCRRWLPCRGIRYRPTVKELDAETGLYYFGARYLDPKTGRWISGDPAVGEYIPSAPVNDEAKKRNGSLPGMGGVFNVVNLHVYHYAGNNPVKYIDPDGEFIFIDDFILAIYFKFKNNLDDSLWDITWELFKYSWNNIVEYGMLLKSIYDSIMNISIPFNKDIEVNLETNISERTFKFNIRNRKKKPHYPTEDAMNEKLNEMIDKHKHTEVQDEV